MKAVAISVRIADFLKQFPPFQFMSMKDLVEISELGKVKFHEEGETVFIQGQPRDQWIYVIQQGKVSIYEDSDDASTLVDYRGAGDLLGLQGTRSDEPFTNTCKTEAETIMYALPRAKFVELSEQSPQARRYLAAYFTLNPAFHDNSGVIPGDEPYGDQLTLRKGGLLEVDPVQSIARSHLCCVGPNEPVSEVAKLLQDKRTTCVLIVDKEGVPLGKLTDADLRDRIIDGSIDNNTLAGDIMFTDLVPLHPADNTGQMLVKLTRNEKSFLIVTDTGNLDGKAIGIVSERNLFLQYGRFPTVIGEAISSARDLTSLRVLRDRMEALILEFLEDRSALGWLMDMVGVLNRKMGTRVVHLMVKSMEQDGWGSPPAKFDLLMMGSGGRDELLIRSAIYHSLVYEDPKPSDERIFSRYFRELGQRIGEGLRSCGFMESEQGILAQNAAWCLPISLMEERYRSLIKDPSDNHVYSARDAFDFRSIQEPETKLSHRLREFIKLTIIESPNFIKHMASDSLMNQPPRTIFKGYVVDNQGIEREELAIKFHAILPVVDIGRVLALETGDVFTTSTYARIKNAALRIDKVDPKKGELLRELSEAFKIAQFARVSRGLRAGTDGAVIRPQNLDAETRTLLITSFRTILSSLEFLASRYQLRLRG